MGYRVTRLRPFIPSGEDFQLSKRFFQQIGFEISWEVDGLAEMRHGEAVFLLQKFHHQEMQENLMMYLSVDDLDAFWSSLKGSGVLESFEGVRAKPPADYPWGVREVHLIDPAGVCWHVA